jgi:predicted O-methyltransferase YrrM
VQPQTKPGADQGIQASQAEPKMSQDGQSLFKSRMAHVRAMQQGFRIEPLGGRLLALKKLLHWFTASAFDRQAKVIESMLNLVEDMGAELERVSQTQRQASLNLNLDQQQHDTASTPAAEAEVRGGWPSRLSAAIKGDAVMEVPERLLLFSLIFGIKPRRCLEIGTFQGGSAAIICSAMDDNGYGRLICVDPHPRVPEQLWEQISHRSTMVQGPSPEVLSEARKAVSYDFDFALIDGDHSHEGVIRDIEGTMAVLVSGAHMLFHDCHFHEVREAIDEALRRHPDQLVDCGVLSVTENPDTGGTIEAHGKQVIWGGFRLLRYIGR